MKVALALFRMLVQKEIGYKSEKSGYAGLIDEAQNYMVVQVTLLSSLGRISENAFVVIAVRCTGLCRRGLSPARNRVNAVLNPDAAARARPTACRVGENPYR